MRFFHFALAATLCSLVTQSASALNLKSIKVNDLDKVVEVPSSTLELHAYEIREGRVSSGKIHTIAGAPRLIEVKSIAQNPVQIFLLRYDAGTAGTSIFMQMDRIAILTSPKGQKNWKVLGDHAIGLRRYQGIQPLLKLERIWEWDAKGLKFRLESFDEDPYVEYVWNPKDKNFKRNIR